MKVVRGSSGVEEVVWKSSFVEDESQRWARVDQSEIARRAVNNQYDSPPPFLNCKLVVSQGQGDPCA